MAFQDIIFSSETYFEGITVENHSRAILTSQKVMDGIIPTGEELHQELINMGGILINSGDSVGYKGSVYKLFDAIYIADVRADNCFLCEKSNALIAYDFIISIEGNIDQALDAMDKIKESLNI